MRAIVLLPAIAALTLGSAGSHGLDAAVRPARQGQEEQRPESLYAFLAQPGCKVPKPDSAQDVVRLVAQSSSEFQPAFFCFALDSTIYGVEASGRGMRLGPGSQRRSFQVRLDSAFTIEGMLYQRYKSVLYLYYQISDGEDGAGLFDALQPPTLRPRWAAPLRTTFNISPVLLDDTVAYVGSLNFVAKVNLRRGRFIWRHFFFHLNPPGRHYYAFNTPQRVGPSVYFPEKPLGLARQAPDTIVVDDRTGRVTAPAAAVHADSMPP